MNFRAPSLLEVSESIELVCDAGMKFTAQFRSEARRLAFVRTIRSRRLRPLPRTSLGPAPCPLPPLVEANGAVMHHTTAALRWMTQRLVSGGGNCAMRGERAAEPMDVTTGSWFAVAN